VNTPPPGLSDFSVGVSEGSVVVVVVVGDSSGLSLSVLHAAVKPIIAMMAAPPTAAEIRRRARRFDAMFGPLLGSLWGETSAAAVARENPVQQSHLGGGIWCQEL
jgi:hypothetical protein